MLSFFWGRRAGEGAWGWGFLGLILGVQCFGSQGHREGSLWQVSSWGSHWFITGKLRFRVSGLGFRV